MICPSEEYALLEKTDVRNAFARAYMDICREQGNLRRLNPENPLLRLVKLTPPDRMDFASNFRAVILEHSAFGEGTNLYAGIGRYVELLIDEQRSPLFAAA